MKGFILNSPLNLSENELLEQNSYPSSSKIKITKALITLDDVLRFRGDIETDNIALSSSGVGVVVETDNNLFNLEKGSHVFIEPNRECGACFNCKSNDKLHCSEMTTMGENVNGFLSDFIIAPCDKIFTLPDSVDDANALFINQISVALAIFDKLNIQKGDYVSIVGANNFGNILAQLMIYYQAVPIIMAQNEDSFLNAKNSGIYYAISPDDNWQKEVASITSGRMTNKVVYISDCNIPLNKAFSLASFGGQIAFTGNFNKSNSTSFSSAVKKQLDITFINNGFGHTMASINLLANKAINFSHLKLASCDYSAVPNTFKTLNSEYENTENITETIVNLV